MHQVRDCPKEVTPSRLIGFGYQRQVDTGDWAELL
jgi:hypothetical protein